MKTIRFTKRGVSHLRKEHNKLLKDKVSSVLDLKKAYEMRDLSENEYYKAAKA